MPDTPRIALVTGGNRGIGFEVCRQLAEGGFTVLLTARDAEKARAAAAKTKIKATGHIEPLVLDVSDARSIERAAAEVSKRHDHLDVLVNNAGINYDTWETAESADIDGTVIETIRTNLLGPWRVCQAFLPLLRKSKAARIVNVSSESGSLEHMGAGPPAYQVTKAALNALTRMLAGELRHAHILVNSVCPGWVATEMGGAGAPRSVEEGATGIIWAATLSQNGPTGGFFRDGKSLPW
jgi:NAD(P)-dependent dehydrogenase (short-subunit alcohol dehydrogenase family)